MLCKEDFAVIKALPQHGVYQKDIGPNWKLPRKWSAGHSDVRGLVKHGPGSASGGSVLVSRSDYPNAGIVQSHIRASWGPGESLVGGTVTPDMFVEECAYASGQFYLHTCWPITALR